MAYAQADALCLNRKNARKQIKYQKSGDKEVEKIDIFPNQRERKPAKGAEKEIDRIKKNMNLFHIITSFRVKKISEKKFESFAEPRVVIHRHKSDIGHGNSLVVSALAVVVADVEDLVVRVTLLGAEI